MCRDAIARGEKERREGGGWARDFPHKHVSSSQRFIIILIAISIIDLYSNLFISMCSHYAKYNY